MLIDQENTDTFILMRRAGEKRTFGIIEIRNITLPENSISSRMIAITHNNKNVIRGNQYIVT